MLTRCLLAKYSGHNEGKSAARFCHQVVECVPDMFCDFYLVESHKIAYNSATTEAREKISTIWNEYNFRKKIYVFD